MLHGPAVAFEVDVGVSFGVNVDLGSGVDAGVGFGVDAGVAFGVDAVMPGCLIKLSSAAALLFLLVLVHVVL